MMKRQFGLLFLICFSLALPAERVETLLEKGWKFSREDNELFSHPRIDDSKWQPVVIPHDWAIYGPFSIDNDKQNVAIAQDGQKEAMEHAGRTGGLPFVGVGWYRLHMKAPLRSENKKVELLFDGAMSEPQVFLNGKKVGEWKYGYNSFVVDISDAISDDGNNLLAVRLENLRESSRWYPGAGLYRNVHLIVTDKIHIPVWGTFVTTPMVSVEYAQVDLKVDVEYDNFVNRNSLELRTVIYDMDNHPVASQVNALRKYEPHQFEQKFVIENPQLWDVNNPYLYEAESQLYENGELVDTYITRFGVRSIEIRPDQGFFLNGEKIIFHGVCNHHDLGPLGVAVNDAAIRRQIRILKDAGCNAIRTSHNMPAPELVSVCDEMGMMLMAESFDEWNIPKCQNGYNRFFNEWAERDLVNLVRHYRNNPSIVMWSIGNEVPNQGYDGECRTAKWLQDIVHREDPTRPVTQGMDNIWAAKDNFAAVMDIPGWNYRSFQYIDHYKMCPQRILLGAETASTVSSRGAYKFPVERKAMAKYEDHQSSAYGVEHCSWSDLPEDNILNYETLPYCIGEFVWTGFDYLGEPSPYYEDWPNHSSLFGFIDLAGIPKDNYYLYRSVWNKESPTLHILPHWTWPGREGETTPIFVYTSYPKAELFINGESQGVVEKDMSVTLDTTVDLNKAAMQDLSRQRRYRLMWMNTKYEPGIVKVVAYNADGSVGEETEVCTAGKPHHIELSVDRDTIFADGKDLAFINVRVVDKNGNLCPTDMREIKFSVKGAGTYRAAANGDVTCLEQFHLPHMHLFYGQLTAIVQSSESPGILTFEATAKGVNKAVMQLQVEE